jgi:hypothetical protein
MLNKNIQPGHKAIEKGIICVNLQRECMLYRISEIVHESIKHPSSFLKPRNAVIAGCAGLVAYRIISKLAEMLIDFLDKKTKTANIRNLFRKPYDLSLFQVMDNVLTRATTDITFLGWRFITVPGYRGRISMEEVADRIEWLSENQADITEGDRRIGQSFVDKIRDLYAAGDNKLNDINTISGFICCLRDNHFDPGANEYGWHKWNGLTLFQSR